MAKRKPAAPPPPTPDRVAKLARAGDYAAALDTARALVQLAPTPEHQALLRRTRADAAAYFADHDRAADFNRVLAELADLDPADRAVLLARGGRTDDALALADDASRPRVFAVAADRAVRHHTNAYLPPELHVGFDAVVVAFRKHEAGDEAGAREALEPIGLRSPFLEWKVLLRGLMAYAASDDARAAENFARLDPARVPARLAAPLRFAVDPAFKQAQPADSAAALATRLRKLTPSPAVEHLRAIARELGRDKPLAPAFRAAELVVSQLKSFAPDLVPRLANCLYHAIVSQGQPDDLAKYRKIFGNPPDDPNFHKLQAMIGEAIGDPAGTHANWLKYEAWLATYPPGWPTAVADRARAEVWTHLGVNAAKADVEEDEPEMGFFLPPPRRKKPPKPLDPPPVVCFARAAELAPDSSDATRRHFEVLLEANRPADAEAVARAYLAHKPSDALALVALAGLIRTQGRAAEAAEVLLRALPLNPLDKSIRIQTSTAIVSEARAALAGGKLADAKAALAVLDRHDTFLTEMSPTGRLVVRSVALQKLGRADEADAAARAALAVPGTRLSVSYRLMVDAQLAKLKPAEKKAADALWAAQLTPLPLPQEVSQLIAAYDLYRLDAVTYRGQKTHEKKVLDQAARCAGTAAPEEEFEKLLDVLISKEEFKTGKKLADALTVRFPANPAILLARAEVGIGLREREYLLESRLRRAKKLVEATTVPRHRELASRIDEMLKPYEMPYDFLDAFFGRR